MQHDDHFASKIRACSGYELINHGSPFIKLNNDNWPHFDQIMCKILELSPGHKKDLKLCTHCNHMIRIIQPDSRDTTTYNRQKYLQRIRGISDLDEFWDIREISNTKRHLKFLEHQNLYLRAGFGSTDTLKCSHDTNIKPTITFPKYSFHKPRKEHDCNQYYSNNPNIMRSSSSISKTKIESINSNSNQNLGPQSAFTSSNSQSESQIKSSDEAVSQATGLLAAECFQGSAFSSLVSTIMDFSLSPTATNSQQTQQQTTRANNSLQPGLQNVNSNQDRCYKLPLRLSDPQWLINIPGLTQETCRWISVEIIPEIEFIGAFSTAIKEQLRKHITRMPNELLEFLVAKVPTPNKLKTALEEVQSSMQALQLRAVTLRMQPNVLKKSPPIFGRYMDVPSKAESGATPEFSLDRALDCTGRQATSPSRIDLQPDVSPMPRSQMIPDFCTCSITPSLAEVVGNNFQCQCQEPRLYPAPTVEDVRRTQAVLSVALKARLELEQAATVATTPPQSKLTESLGKRNPLDLTPTQEHSVEQTN